jgi:hypothetical protein
VLVFRLYDVRLFRPSGHVGLGIGSCGVILYWVLGRIISDFGSYQIGSGLISGQVSDHLMSDYFEFQIVLDMSESDRFIGSDRILPLNLTNRTSQIIF